MLPSVIFAILEAVPLSCQRVTLVLMVASSLLLRARF
ncbi:hypothetical protein BAZSYMA_ACONTIG00457_3 [Bathymodiolus azoricus thioautotrophic gill symbiont]|uniref:Uncharacterized protein n=1 Tax=Bathymodiolus azoricus thioautotrophic gill symbiont TaxID=235205 RepID=A0A1H6M5Z2_9GAMM|nr:hypothetical protein BAZSYMA_ACONTIG00457_3 [Bathymodiolus azoricus thioautotrophic gill symbiont]